jgi:hypothetical protein
MDKQAMNVWFGGSKLTKKGRRQQRRPVAIKFVLPKVRRKGNG